MITIEDFKSDLHCDKCKSQKCNECFEDHPLNSFEELKLNKAIFKEFSHCSNAMEKNNLKGIIADLINNAADYVRKKPPITKRVKYPNFIKCTETSTTPEIYGSSRESASRGISSATSQYGSSFAEGNCAISGATGNFGASRMIGNGGVSAATGDFSVSLSEKEGGMSATSGICSISSSTGYKSVSSATGSIGIASSTGKCGISASTGDGGLASAVGLRGASLSTGYKGVSSISGRRGVSAVTGDFSSSSATGKDSVAVAWGYQSKARGVIGSYLVFADWGESKTECYYHKKRKIRGTKIVLVDGKNIKENVWYIMKNGSVTELTENEEDRERFILDLPFDLPLGETLMPGYGDVEEE